ncbi:azurin [Zwartia panacis]|uniref:azurin n=1 Tax=Zwartia panacis TaxID=2683345 RepID=UPI0025B4EFD0|nr:azurin [Zwartia panacis]MDN4017198.1 azurin [Zwartia panacis]
MQTLPCLIKACRTLLIASALSVMHQVAFAQHCATTIESDDALRYVPDKIEIPLACQSYTVTLKHSGRLPKLAMGHNWVLAKLSDLDGVARTGMLAGADHQYVDPKDTRVLAHTGVVGGAESTSVTFDVNKLVPGERYGFVCTFAGHSPIMRGTIVLK